MTIDYLIIGQGICGTFLSHELEKSGSSFLVIDQPTPFSASSVASGIINPVTGRRIVKTWMIDELMPFAWNAYQDLEDRFKIQCIQETRITDFFPTPQMRLAFLERFAADPQYLSIPEDDASWSQYLNYDFGYGIIKPCFLVDIDILLKVYRQSLLFKGCLSEEIFEAKELIIVASHVRYRDITAKRIIFCDGVQSASNPWFTLLPFAPNKGEALIVEIPDLPVTGIIKKGINIVPWKDGSWWVGSSHEWKFENDQPTKVFRDKTAAWLKSLLKIPFKIVDHLASVRPATLERRPFAGFHPVHPAIGIFNGMGTKGCSLAPFFARNLAEHLTMGSPLFPEVDVLRFKNVLSRQQR